MHLCVYLQQKKDDLFSIFALKCKTPSIEWFWTAVHWKEEETPKQQFDASDFLAGAFPSSSLKKYCSGFTKFLLFATRTKGRSLQSIFSYALTWSSSPCAPTWRDGSSPSPSCIPCSRDSKDRSAEGTSELFIKDQYRTWQFFVMVFVNESVRIEKLLTVFVALRQFLSSILAKI